MNINAKKLAQILNISEAAVSMALNNKPGVSTYTRNLVINKANELGYDFSRIERKNPKPNIIHKILFIVYHDNASIVNDTPFFSKLFEGINEGCKENGFQLYINYFYQNDNIIEFIDTINKANYSGVILLGTEICSSELKKFMNLKMPVILLDSYFEDINMNYVVINNNQGAYIATNNLIKQYNIQPGYLKSSYTIQNFNERADGYFKAIRINGLSTSKSIIHTISPTLDGAYYDLLDILKDGIKPQRAYFADNDLIAIGAIKALIEFGYKIPDDVAIIGFDNINKNCNPSITTIDVPKIEMGKIAVNRLKQVIDGDKIAIKIEIGTSLIIKDSSK